MPDDEATAYAVAVTDGKIVAGPHVRAACKRHLDDLANGSERGLAWSTEAVDYVLGYFRKVLTVEVEEPGDDGGVISKPVKFMPQPWQCFILGSLFGWKTKEGLRRFRRAYIEVGKGNGKSPMAAGIGHFMLTSTGKIRAEIYSAATDRDQAAILFRDAVEMWRRSPPLLKRLVPSGQNPTWQLTDIGRASFFKPISSEKKGKSGIRPYCALIDEVHEHPNNDVIEMLRAGTKGNQDALIFEITNSGFDRKSVCYSEHQYTVQVVHGDQQNDQWFGYIASLDDNDDPFADEACWIKANPNLGVSIRLPYIREQVKEAQGMPSKESMVRRLHFCQWVESDVAAFTREAIARVLGEVDGEELKARGYPCFGGLDLSRVGDLSCFSLVWLLDEKADAWRFAAKTIFWTPRDNIVERSKRDRAHYDRWAEDGFIEAVPGKRIGYGWVAEALGSLGARFEPVSIGCDQYGLEQLREQLDDRGISLPLIVHPQGFYKRKVSADEYSYEGAEDISLWMPDSINKLEAAVLEERIVIEDNPVMRMCMTGVIYEENRTGHRMFSKNKATTRIDGAVSLAMAIGTATIGSRAVNVETMIF